MLALNFVFSKTKIFKLLFILFVIKQLLDNLTSDIDFYSAKQSIVGWVVVIQTETLHALSVLIFACFYVYELKKIVFREYLFLRMASFWKFRVYQFQPPPIPLKKLN